MSAPILNNSSLYLLYTNKKFADAFNAAKSAGQKYFRWGKGVYNTISDKDLRGSGFLNYKDLRSRDIAAVNQSMVDDPTAWSNTTDWNKLKSGITVNGQTNNLTNSEVQDFYRPIQRVSVVSTEVPVPEAKSILIDQPAKVYNRADTRQFLREEGINPYSMSGWDRNSYRAIINGKASVADFNRFANADGVTEQTKNELIALRDADPNRALVRTKAQTRDFIKGMTSKSAYNYTGAERAALRRVLTTGATDDDWKMAGNMFANPNLNKESDLYAILKAILDKHNASVTTKKNGGSLNKKDAFVSYLADKNPDKDINKLIEELASTPGNEGSKLDEQYKEFESMLDNSQSITAKNGAKLNYLKSLRGSCPEGYETSYYREGGQICSKCVEAKKGTKVNNKKLFFKPSIPADEMPAKKCGGQVKSKQEGGKATDAEKKKINPSAPSTISIHNPQNNTTTTYEGNGKETTDHLNSKGQVVGRTRKTKNGSEATGTDANGKSLKAACGKKLSKKCKRGGVLYFN